jgi:hypothetical protein
MYLSGLTTATDEASPVSIPLSSLQIWFFRLEIMDDCVSDYAEKKKKKGTDLFNTSYFLVADRLFRVSPGCQKIDLPPHCCPTFLSSP